MKNTYFLVILFVLAILTLAGFPEAQNIGKCLTGETHGFVDGLWHGAVMPVSFIASIFDEKAAIYAVNNNGAWYNFGFLLGFSAVWGEILRRTNPTKEQKEDAS